MTIGAVRGILVVGAVLFVPACSGSGVGSQATRPAAKPATSLPNAADGPQLSDERSASSVCWTSSPARGEGIRFDDETESVGLVEPLLGMYGHAVAAGDVNRDGWTDLFVGGFADRPTEQYEERGATGPSPERLLLGSANGFSIDTGFPGELARTSGSTMADLDADGDLDIVAVRNSRGDSDIGMSGTVIYEQQDGSWRRGDVVLEGAAGRSVAAFDIDRDGLLDLAVAADRYGAESSRLLRNVGGLRFEDATSEWGFPDDVLGLALAPVDLDLDGWTDIVVSGEPRVMMGGPEGFTVDVQKALRSVPYGNEDDDAGVAIGDLNQDGRADLVIGQHFNSTVDDGRLVPVRVLINRTSGEGFELMDVTDDSGSPGLNTKSPHVAIVDIDNDGLVDIVTSAVSAEGTPIVLRSIGDAGSAVPTFETIGRFGAGSYFVTGVETDFNRDGGVDLFQVAWEPAVASSLFSNRSASGSWVEIDLAGVSGVLDSSQLEVLPAEPGGTPLMVWGGSTGGYAAGPPPVLHAGLGDSPAAEVEVLVTSAGAQLFSMTVPVNSRLAVAGC